VGLTAGTSTPDEVIESVHQALLRIAGAAAAKE
jgi:4-hydroxy-3-methylbut-2-enyl diphosphate reductase IspH